MDSKHDNSSAWYYTCVHVYQVTHLLIYTVYICILVQQQVKYSVGIKIARNKSQTNQNAKHEQISILDYVLWQLVNLQYTKQLVIFN